MLIVNYWRVEIKRKSYIAQLWFLIFCYFYISCDFTKKVGLLRKRYKNDKKTYKLPSHIGLKFPLIFWHQLPIFTRWFSRNTNFNLPYNLKNWSEFVQAMVRVQKKYTFNFLGTLFNKRKIVALFLPVFWSTMCVRPMHIRFMCVIYFLWIFREMKHWHIYLLKFFSGTSVSVSLFYKFF